MGVHTFEGVILQRSARALMFQSHYWEGGVWFPNSQVEVLPDGDMSVVVHVNDWLASKRGILEFTPYSVHDIERIAAT
jgi:hypothetical protein